MNLLLDIGNSRVKWALVDGEAWLAEGAEGLDQQQAGWPLLDRVEKAPERVLAVCVAGDELAEGIADRVRRRWRLALELAETGTEFDGLRNGYRDPHQLGADRWLALLAARRATTGAVCVVDVGTALTVDLVEADGQHLGGYILPGPELMRCSLEQATGDIRRRAAALAAGAGRHGPGRDTASAIEGASLQAALGLVDRARTMTSTPAALVVSGGGAPALLAGLPADTAHRPRLVLEGLALALAGQAENAGA